MIACAGSPAPSAPAASAAAPPPAAAMTLRDRPPLASPGEHMQYRLSLQGVELATYELDVGDVTDLAGRRAIVVQGHAKVIGVAAFLATIDDRFTSWIDVANGHSLRFQVDEYASGSKIDVEHVAVDLAARDGDTIPVTFRLNNAPPLSERQKASQPVVWDFNTFLFALRSWEAAPGSRLSCEVFRSRYLWHTDVEIHGKERLVTELGELPALRIVGRTYKLDRKGVRAQSSAERTYTMWISDDDGRVPLAIRATTDYGDLKMQIIDYQPGTGQRF